MDGVEQGLVVLLLAAVVLKFVDFVKYAKAGDWNGIATQLLSWLAGIVLVMIAAKSAFADQIVFSGVSLADAGFWTQVIMGFALASLASAGKDALQALAGRKSSAPELIEDTGTATTE